MILDHQIHKSVHKFIFIYVSKFAFLINVKGPDIKLPWNNDYGSHIRGGTPAIMVRGNK